MKKKRAFADWLLVFILLLVLAAAVMMTVYIVTASAPVEHPFEDEAGASLIQMQPMKRNEAQPEDNFTPVFTVVETQNERFLLVSVEAESQEEIQVTISSANRSEVIIPSRIGEEHIYGMLLEPGIYTLQAADADGKTVDAIVSIADQQVYSYKLTFLQE